MCIAVNLPKTLRTIPIAFTIGFSGKALEYVKLWKYVSLMFRKHNVNYSNAIVISDLGKSETSAIKNFNLLNSFYCWWHTLDKCFIPNIHKKIIEKPLENILITRIRDIYSSKTLEHRNEMVKLFFEELNNEPVLKEYFEPYMKDDILDKWSSLYKISQYAEHTSNYIERFFGEITNKNIAKQSKLLKFVKHVHDIIDVLIINHRNGKKTKMKKCKVNYNTGYEIYLHLEKKEISENVFRVPSSEDGKYHTVDIDNWCCSCFKTKLLCL